MGEAKRMGAAGINPPVYPEFIFQKHSHCEHDGPLCGFVVFEPRGRSADELQRYVASLVDELLDRARDGQDLDFYMAAPVGADPSKGKQLTPAEIKTWYARSVCARFTVNAQGEVTYFPLELPKAAESRTTHAEWAPGSRLLTHLGTCIRCGSPDGDTVVYARIREEGGDLMMVPDGIANRLCPSCKARLDDEMHRELDRLDDQVWPDLKKRGCPCCEAGLTWLPADQVH